MRKSYCSPRCGKAVAEGATRLAAPCICCRPAPLAEDGIPAAPPPRSRIGDFPEVIGFMPVSIITDEITTPGKGQLKALLTIGGNPVLSVPNGRKLDQALGELDLHVVVDHRISNEHRGRSQTARRAARGEPAPQRREIGRHLRHAELLMHHHAVIYSSGAPDDRKARHSRRRSTRQRPRRRDRRLAQRPSGLP
jgi:hypothetical protein